MATFEDRAAVRPDMWGVSLGGVEGDYIGFVESMKVGFATDAKPINNARTGDEIGMWNNRTTILLELVVTQSAQADWERFLGTTGGVLPEQAFLPTFRLRLHDPAAANANGDLLFYAATVTSIDTDTDGADPKKLVVKMRCTNDATGKKFKLGSTF